MRCPAAGLPGDLDRGRPKRGLQEALQSEIVEEIEALIGPDAVDGLDLEAIETAVRHRALRVAARAVERRQLLLSLTPLYLGWVAGFVEETQSLAPEAVEDRVESLCLAFEREKRYLISRWRWPDAF